MKRVNYIKSVLSALLAIALLPGRASAVCDAANADSVRITAVEIPLIAEIPTDMHLQAVSPYAVHHDTRLKSIYDDPYSMTYREPDWHQLWVNTAVLTGAFVGSLLVLECLPADATAWNRAEIRNVPLFKRWNNHVIKQGPEWDHDKFYFNYILHPYAGAAYFMAARSCGFNMWQSLLYSALISSVGWEFGIEAFMERPSYQDLFITPIVGSAIGECFYKLKRKIVDDGYTLFGSPVVGNIVAFLIDPVNEVVGLFSGNPCRKIAAQKRRARLTSSFMSVGAYNRPTLGFSFACTF